MANDGGMYFLRQIGDVLWWLGLSGGLMHPGLEFCNIFHGSVTASAVAGDWCDVPRGATSGRGTLTLRPAGGHQLLRVGESGGFGASIWRRTSHSTWPVIVVGDAFAVTLRNVVRAGDGYAKATLATSLQPLRDSVSVFAVVARSADDGAPPVTVSYPGVPGVPLRDFSYRDFICLNEPAAFGGGDQPDGDVTFWFQADAGQVMARQPGFFAGVEPRRDLPRDQIEEKLAMPVEGAILMFGRSADCGDQGAETALPCFPGWAERTAGSAVIFNGKPIHVVVPAPGGGPPGEPDFLTELSFGDTVRVTGALVFDTSHGSGNQGKLRIHPVYAIEKITASFARDLSGAWADDAGNTYYLSHDLTDETVWYAAISPLGREAFGQVFRGTFHPRQVAGEPAGAGGSPVAPQSAVTGDVVALDFGYGSTPPPDLTGSRIGATGALTLGLGRTALAGREIPMLSAGEFRLMKLHDA
jgi:hypothetical protein